MAWTPIQNPGEHHPKIPAAKTVLNKFSYGKGLGTTDIYTVPFGAALRQFQANIHTQVVFKGRPGPDVNLDGIFDWATQKQLGVLPPDTQISKPVIFTIAGHLCDMLDGPPYFTARTLELQGAARVQMIGYDNVALPFRNSTGLSELNRCVNDPVILPPGTPWALCAHSQGAMVASQYYCDVIRPNKDTGPYKDFRGALTYGNPWRQKDVVAAWVPDPPTPGSQGLNRRRMTDTPPEWMEVARHLDLYAENGQDLSSQNKTAICTAVCNEWTGTDSLAEQVGEIVLAGGKGLWSVFTAIVSGIRGAASLDHHNMFDLGPGVEHLRRILT